MTRRYGSYFRVISARWSLWSVIIEMAFETNNELEENYVIFGSLRARHYDEAIKCGVAHRSVKH